MADPSEIVPIVAGPATVAVWELGKWIFLGRLQKAEEKAEKAEDQADKKTEDKLDQVLELVSRMEREMALMARDLSTHAGTVAEVKGRVEGMSANYGQRLSQLERDIVEMRAEMKNRRARK